ncbi:hypothetical protein [Hugenholtzia roseola]|uniref:hypothetical protein n=1 Tax=Hugenholtzia roseola TaxID=1002 RepID=UPI00040B73F7|nr:hypothetical protein [Hugenholtzia roseola]
MSNWGNDNFEDHFKRIFEEAEIAPPDAIWKNIEAKLSPPWYRRPAFWGSFTVLTLLLGFLFWITLNPNPITTQVAATPKSAAPSQAETAPAKQALAHNLEQTPTNTESPNAPSQLLAQATSANSNQFEKPNRKVSQKAAKMEVLEPKQEKNQEKIIALAQSEPQKEAPEKVSQDALILADVLADKQSAISLENLAFVALPSDQNPQLVFLPLISFESENRAAAQTPTNDDKPAPKNALALYVGLQAGMGSQTYRYSAPQNLQVVEWNGTERSDFQTDLLKNPLRSTVQNVGIDLAVGLGKRWQLQSGLFLSNQVAFSLATTDYERSPDIASDEYFPRPNQWSYSRQDLTLPLLLSYQANESDKKLTAFVSAGTVFVLRLQESMQTERVGVSYLMPDSRPLVPQIALQTGLQYRLAPRLYWTAALQYRSTVGNLFEGGGLKGSQENVEIRTGLRFKLTK